MRQRSGGAFISALILWSLLVPTLSARAQSACAREVVATAPLADDDGFITVLATLEGRPVRFVLDTGAEAGLVTDAFAHGRPRDPTHRTRLQGTGGAGQAVPNVVLAGLRLGELILPPLSMPVGTLPAIPAGPPAVAGLLGADLLQRFDLELDLPHGRLLLWRIGHGSVMCTPPPAWEGSFARIAMTQDAGRPVLEGRLDGQTVSILLDSGARSRVVSRTAALRVGVSAEILDGEPGGITAGVDLHEKPYHWHRFRTLEIGGERVSRPVLTVAPIAERFDMLLGTDWFATRDVWISRSAGAVFVRDQP